MNPYHNHIFGGALGRRPIFITDQFGNQTKQPDSDCIAVPFAKKFKWPEDIKQRYEKDYPGLLELILRMVSHVCFVSFCVFSSVEPSLYSVYLSLVVISVMVCVCCMFRNQRIESV